MAGKAQGVKRLELCRLYERLWREYKPYPVRIFCLFAVCAVYPFFPHIAYQTEFIC
jgi:hypothetical protein